MWFGSRCCMGSINVWSYVRYFTFQLWAAFPHCSVMLLNGLQTPPPLSCHYLIARFIHKHQQHYHVTTLQHDLSTNTTNIIMSLPYSTIYPQIIDEIMNWSYKCVAGRGTNGLLINHPNNQCLYCSNSFLISLQKRPLKNFTQLI